VHSLTSQATINLSAGSLALGSATSEIDAAFSVNTAGTLSLNNTTLNGSGTLRNDSQGTVVAQGSDSINCTFTNASGAVLRVQGSFSSSAILTFAAGFTNSGAIELTNNFPPIAYGATLNVSSGTLTNAGSLSALPGAGGGARTLGAELDNRGTLTVGQA